MLGAREQRILAEITDELTGSDPELSALLGTFSRLASGEAMPARERVRPYSRPHGAGARSRRRLTLSQAALLGWLIVTAVLIGIALILSHADGPGTCAPSLAAVCPVPSPSHATSPSHPDDG